MKEKVYKSFCINSGNLKSKDINTASKMKILYMNKVFTDT